MNFSVFLFSVLYLISVSCEKCSQALEEAFKKAFNLTDSCDDCVVLSPGIFFRGENWAGFCTGNRFFLFKDRKCRNEYDLMKASDPVVVATKEFCESVRGYDLDLECLKEFNAMICNGLTDTRNLRKRDIEKKFNVKPIQSGSENNSENAAFESSFGNRSNVTESLASAAEANSTQSTESESTEATAVESTEKSSTSITCETLNSSTSPKSLKTATVQEGHGKEANSTTIKSTSPEIKFSFIAEPQRLVKKTCEKNEFFFNDHCYFVKLYWKGFDDIKYSFKNFEQNANKKILPSLINFTESCRKQHPKALGLAVETKEENEFVLDFLKTFHLYDKYIIITSGVRMLGQPDEWKSWNLKINQSVLKFGERDFDSADAFYCIDACKSYWYLFRFENFNQWDGNLFVVCERLYNPKNIQLELHESCLDMYRKSSCYNPEKHSNYCCEKDETGEIWFECPNMTHVKNYSDSLTCSWICKSNGFFNEDRPTCKGNYFCNDSYNHITYIAPITRYALSECPKNYFGFSTWYCNRNRTFLGTPDYSLCCEDSKLHCRDTDAFLNVWMGCPAKKIIKKTTCPPGTILEEADAEWHCQKNGTFNGTAPNYSNCNLSEIVCSKKDKYGIEWVAAAGITGKKNCPPNFTGQCLWKCSKFGEFDGPEPDCSKCKAAWMDEIAEKIKNHSDHEEVMKVMENQIKNQDLGIGYGHVLNLTADCVILFKKQNPDGKFENLDKFLKSYSKILKNVAGNSNLWSSFSVTNRKAYAEQIIEITQTAAFANLDSKNVSDDAYNVTFAKSKEDGFEFFVAYNLALGSQFPLENISESDWKLDIKEINISGAFAAMGLAMSYSLSSLMFPQGNTTEHLVLNSPAVTFAIAASKDGQLVDPEVVVSISFKHRNRTRLPQSEIIPRKLHRGEQPSGVFNSTLCYYYRNSDWNTEGCTVTYTSKDQTNCTCSHLSTIGLLMSIHKYKSNKTLEVISIISSGVTILSLIVTLLVFYFLDTVQNDRVLIGKNVCFCLLLGHTMLITVMDKKFFNIPDNLCTIYAILLHYIFMAAFAWMFVEGCHLYRMLVLVFDSDLEYRWIYLLIGYGAPFVIVSVTRLIGLFFDEQPYGQDEMCWLKPPNYIWAFVGPVIVSTSINFCILITAMKLAISAKRRTEKSNFATLKLWIKGWISLSTLLGITWLFGLAYVHYNETFVYTFVVFNGLQGFFIFLFRCVLSEQYKATFMEKLKCWFSKSQSKIRKKSKNLRSETKLYAISATKSSSEEMEVKDSGYSPGTDGVGKPKKYKTELTELFQLKTKTCNKPADNSSGVDIDINIKLKPALSEAYLRNRMIARNFSVRKSKAACLAESDNDPDLSFHNAYLPN